MNFVDNRPIHRARIVQFASAPEREKREFIDRWLDARGSSTKGMERVSLVATIVGAAAFPLSVIEPAASHSAWVGAVVFCLFHLLVLLPALTFAAARSALDRVNGEGDEEGHQLHLLVIPDAPRPLYFHLAAGALRRVRAKADAACGWAMLAYALGGFAMGMTLNGWNPDAVVKTVAALLGAFLIGGMCAGFALALAPRLAVAFSPLGEWSAAALEMTAPRFHRPPTRDEGRAMDEEWGARGVEGAVGLVRYRAAKALLQLVALALYVPIMLGAFLLLPFLAGNIASAWSDALAVRVFFWSLLPLGFAMLFPAHRFCARLARRLFPARLRSRYRLFLPT